MQTIEKVLAEFESVLRAQGDAGEWDIELYVAQDYIGKIRTALRGYQPTEGEAAPSVTGEVVGEWPRVDVERKFDELYPDAEYRATDLEFFWAGVRHCEARLQRHLAPPTSRGRKRSGCGWRQPIDYGK
jgi:hypothetical protein